MRKLLIGLGGLVALAVAAALIVPSLIDWNEYKGEIAARVKAATGRDLTIAGDLDLSVLPSPRLSVAGVRFANIAGAAEPDMARLKSLDVRIAVLPLLRGRLQVTAVKLVEPVIVLETLADGRANWTFATAGDAPSGSAAGTAERPAAGGAPASGDAFGIDSLRIQRGTVIWRDAAAGTEERIERLDADIHVRSLAGPFQLKGAMVARGMKFGVVLGVGRLAADNGPAPVSLAVTLADADAKVEFGGALTGPLDEARLAGLLEASGKNLARVIAAASGSGASPVAALARPFGLRGRLDGSAGGGGLTDLEIDIGGARATGEATLALGGQARAAIRLKAGRIDLSPWFAAAPAAPRPSAGARSPAVPAAVAAAAPFALPEGIEGTFEFAVDAVLYGGEAVQDVRIAARLADGELTLEQASLRLPGTGGEAMVAGFLNARDGRPNFDGTMEARADNLRTLLGWLKVDLAGVPADRLRKFALTARLRGDDRQVQVIGAKISVDTSRIDAGVTLALRERLAFGANVTVDQLNLDAYTRPEGQTQAAPAGAAAGAVAGAASGSSDPARGPLAALGNFDANLRLQIGSLTWRRTQARDLKFDGTLAQGTLIMRDVAVGDLAGTSARITGTLSGFDGMPAFRGGFAADSNDIGGLMRIAGIEPPPAVRTLGKVGLRGKADGGAEKMTVDAALDLAGGRLAVAGTLDGLPLKPRFDAKLDADHADPAGLARAFGIDLPADRKLGPLALAATVKGDLAALNADARLRLLGGEASLVGGMTGFGSAAPAYEMALRVNHPSYNAMMQGLAPGYRPAERAIGPVRIEANLKGTGDAATLAGLRLQAGRIALTGDGRLALDGARPKLTASLAGGTLDFNPFLPAEPSAAPRAPSHAGVPGPGGGGPPTAERFSSEPFDLSALGNLDADLSVGADAVVWRNFRIEKPAAKATLADRVLAVERLAGRMFDGALMMKGTLDAGAVPAIDGSVTVDKANVGKALFEAASFDVAGGTLDFSMNLAGAGASPRALVAALDGGGRIDIRDGTVKGFDLPAVSDRLKNIDRGLDILSLFGAAMGGGETRFSSLAGTFKVDDGVLRTSDLKLVAQAGEGQAAGFADLPRWTMDFKTEFRLTEHASAPPFGMTVRGPIDNPQRILQIEQLQSHLVQRGVGTLLRKVFPGARQDTPQQPAAGPPGQESSPATPQQPQRQRPEDILRGLLQGLGRPGQ